MKTVFAGFACALMVLVAVTPARAANSLREGALAISAEASSSPLIGLKWNVTEKNALFGGVRFENISGIDIPLEHRTEDVTTFGLALAFFHYWEPDDFSPYAGASFDVTSISNHFDSTDWGVRGFIGIEAFLMRNASVAADLGLRLGTANDGDQTVIRTSTSAVRFNLYFR